MRLPICREEQDACMCSRFPSGHLQESLSHDSRWVCIKLAGYLRILVDVAI